MKVCMLAYTFYEADNRVRRYAEALAQAGHEVHVFSLRWGDLPKSSVFQGVQVFRLQDRDLRENSRSGYLQGLLRFMGKAFLKITLEHLKGRYDVIHAHSVPDFIVFSALIPRLAGVPLILDIHDILPEFYAFRFHLGPTSWMFRLLVLIEQVCSRFASHIIVANDLWRDRLISRSVRPDDCSTFLNYPDPALFRPFRPKRPNPRFVMIYPGTLSRLQGLDVAIRALPLILAQRRDVELRMYGNGPAVEELRALIQELHLEEHAFILEPKALDAVPEMVIDADLGVVPKRGQGFPGEAFSTKILEFMAVGVPVLVSRTRIDQYYFSPENVRFFEPESVEEFAQQVLELIAKPSERERLREGGFKLIEQHGWARHRERYRVLVASLTR